MTGTPAIRSALTQPYPGLRPFLHAEADIFFGRAADINRMLACLESNRFLAVVGGSGSGKSSLVRAGLLPVLGQGYLLGAGTDWRFVVMRPGGHPFGNLAAQFHRAIDGGEVPDPGDVAFTQASLQTSPRGFLDVLEEAGLETEAPVLLLVDQFEEIFRFRRRRAGGEGARPIHEERNDASAFVNLLLTTAQAAAKTDLPIYVMLTMRSDFMGDCDVFPGLPQAISDSQFLVPRLSRRQMQEVIEKPLLLFGWKAAPDLVNQMLNAAGTDPDQLPLMQHALMRTWLAAQARFGGGNEEKVLTLGDYEKVGGFSDALSQHLEEAWATLAGEREQRIAQQLFLCLSEQGGGGALFRRMVKLGEVAALADAEPAEVMKVVRVFQEEGRNFIMASPPGELSAESVLDISHEALLRQWDRLRSWLEKETKSAEEYLRLEDDARRWQAHSQGFLLSPELDITLKQYQEEKWTPVWARRYGTGFELAMQYLEESQAEKKRRDAEEEARRNELAGERARAAQQEQKAARSRQAVFVLGALLTVIAVLAIFAVVQSMKAHKQSKIARAQTMAVRAYQLRDERLDTALLLATEAQKLATDAQPDKILPDTFGTLIAAAHYNPRLHTYLHGYLHGGNSPINAVAFSHDGKQVATGDFDGNLALWDTETYCKAEDGKLPKLRGAVRAIAFSPDGRYMAVSGDDKKPSKTVVLYDLKKREPKPLRPGPNAEKVFSLAFSGDSNLLASGDANGNVVIRDLMADSAVTLSDASNKAVRGLSFYNDAKFLAAGYYDGRILIWTRNEQGDEWQPAGRDFASEHPKNPKLNSERPKGKKIRCLMVSPNGKNLAVGRWSGAVDLYDLISSSDPSLPLPLNVTAYGWHDSLVTSLAFAADSKRLITAGNDGTLLLWDVPSMKQVGPPFTGHVGRVFSVAFSPVSKHAASAGEDGRTILWNTTEHVAQTVRAEKSDGNFNVAFSPDGAWEAYGYNQGKVTLRKRDLRDWEKYHEKELPAASSDEDEKGVSIVTFSDDGRRLATATKEGGLLRVYDLTKGVNDVTPPIKEIAVSATAKDASKSAKITSIGLSRDGSRIAAGLTTAGKQQAAIWNVATAAKLDDLPIDYDKETVAIQFSPDGKRLVLAGGWSKEAVILTVGESGKLSKTKTLTEHTGSVRSVAFSPDGKTIATASGDTRLILWDAESGKQIRTPLTGHKTAVVTAAFSHDGKLLASGSEDNSVILWDVETGLLMGPLTEHTDTVRAVAFSRDEYDLRLMSVDTTGDLVHEGRSLVIVAVVGADLHIRIFNASGQIIVDRAAKELVNEETKADLADLRKRTRLSPLPDESLLSQKVKKEIINSATSIAGLTPIESDERLYSGSWNEESRLWELDPSKLQEICRRRANRNLSKTEWKAYIRPGEYEYRKTWPDLPEPGGSPPPK